MHSLILVLLIRYVYTQQQDLCHCSCCIGQSCIPNYVGATSVLSCTSELCRMYCRYSYAQCQVDSSNGQIIPQCSSNSTTINPLYNCRCDCCQTGSPACTPNFVGYSTAYLCQSSACSISCAVQYPSQCISNQNGQTNGLCLGPITTTTTLAPTTVSTSGGSGSSYRCSCLCCQSGPNCSPNSEVGITFAGECTSSACTTACQNQYSTACPSNYYLGCTNGVCRGLSSTTNQCGCQCCGLTGCPTYNVYTNAGCASCATLCSQRCNYTNPLTITCDSNGSIKDSLPLSLRLLLSILIFILLLYSDFWENSHWIRMRYFLSQMNGLSPIITALFLILLSNLMYLTNDNLWPMWIDRWLRNSQFIQEWRRNLFGYHSINWTQTISIIVRFNISSFDESTPLTKR